MKLYISDLHFGHANVINFDHRQFSDVDEMDRFLIDNWNARVQKNDDVYIVGDFAFRNGKDAVWYLDKLRGHKHLVIGNHDHHTLMNHQAMERFVTVDKIMHIKDGDKQIVLCHYPIAEWNGYFRGSWLIYGHIHGRRGKAYQFMKTEERALNAAACINNYMPCSFEELVRNNRIFQESEGDETSDDEMRMQEEDEDT
ncbi:MAG: hydrolase [Lachnospiraceae bacterium]